MASFAPFETLPQLAVAVSGGPDSLALVHLADRWARRRGGSVIALIVDHRLRPESGREAHRVAGWMAAAGIARRILRAGGPLPEANIQDWARDSRYRLLTAACRRAGILHLLTAHHRDDQAETLLLRLGRGSGLDGLSAMAPVVELTDCRLLRPFLPVAKSELVGWLRSKGLEWIDDPGNASTTFARGALRRRAEILAALGLTAERLAETAGRLAADRAALEGISARWLARHAIVDRAGYVTVDREAFVIVEPALARRVMAAALATVGGTGYPPRRQQLGRLVAAIADSVEGGATLAGCRLNWTGRRISVFREAAAASQIVDLSAASDIVWDHRFHLRVAAPARASMKGLSLRCLGAAGWRQFGRKNASDIALTMPHAARLALPAIFRSETVIAVPLLDYGPGRRGADILRGVDVAFRPVRALAPMFFAIADRPERPM